MNASLAWLSENLSKLEGDNLLRQLQSRAGSQSARIVMDGRRYINFGSNDYLHLAADPRLKDAVERTVRRGGWGSGASPLVCGRSSLHAELERKLAAFEGTEAALLFPSGYAANIGTITALAGKGDQVFSDQKNHASIIDGCRLSGAEVRIYPHNDVATLVSMLAASHQTGRKLIVTDSLFSMDGDHAPIAQLVELAEKHQAMLMVDEAHATGVFGERGTGVCESLGLEDRVPIRVGTLSKALGSIGGFVAGSRNLIEWLTNRARPYVFSTALPAAAAAATLAAFGIIRDEPRRRSELLGRAESLRSSLRQQGWQVGAGESQIIPIIVGSPETAMSTADKLRNAGCFVPAIRPPSVPEGESLLRVSLTWGHSDEDIQQLIASFDAVR